MDTFSAHREALHTPMGLREGATSISHGQLPVTQATPARHPRPAPEFLREHLPVAAKHEDDVGEARAIRNARPTTLWPSWGNRQERFDKIPQRIWKQRGGHTPFTLLRRQESSSGGCYALLACETECLAPESRLPERRRRAALRLAECPAEVAMAIEVEVRTQGGEVVVLRQQPSARASRSRI
jgi:hypothetical protein